MKAFKSIAEVQILGSLLEGKKEKKEEKMASPSIPECLMTAISIDKREF
jgi:hypothetical protein